jgi:Domain of unknown function (DUF4394)
MSLSSRTLLTTAALAAAMLAPSAANAAEGFTAVTSDGQIAQLHSDTSPGLSGIHTVTGLAAGERIVGLDRAPSGELLALTSAGNIASVDRDSGKATVKFAAPVTAAVDPNAPLTFAVAPDGASARIITAGRDVSINLASGAATAGSGLTFAAGDANAGVQATASLDYAADGRLIGVAGAQGAYAVQSAAGAATLQTLDATPVPDSEPERSTVASDGSVWTAANVTEKPNRPAQSRLVRYDPATSQIRGQNGAFLGVRLDALTADGAVADDKTAPNATFSGTVIQREVKHGNAYWNGLRLRTSEGGQTVASLRLNGKVVGFGLLTRYSAGSASIDFGATRKGASALRRAAKAHRKAIVHLTVRDWAGNKHIYDRAVGLAL